MIQNDWDEILASEWTKDYFKTLTETIKKEYQTHTCYPPIHHVFDSFRLTPYHQCKVVILGQDPYHQPNQAMGLCFSVPTGVAFPPSLANILQEYSSDLNYSLPQSGDLSSWGRQGVLLLNSILSVRQNQPLSHQRFGWETFTDEVIAKLNEKTTPVVFVLWGQQARSKKSLITNPWHFIIENVHPSPLSAYRGFLGSKPFSTINKLLKQSHQTEIDFHLT
jgi:uracil-DNA glycosylase